MVKAYSYLRFSTTEQMKGDSHRRQTALATDYCSKKGLTLDTEVTYADLGVSAFRGKNSETGRLGEFLEACKAGLVPPGSFLLVESLDRVSRQAARKALRTLEDICDEGIVVVTLNDGKEYTKEDLDTDPMSLLMSILIFMRANEESITKSRRLKSAWVGKRLKVKQGIVTTSRSPAWFKFNETTRQFFLDHDRAEIVRRIFKEASDGRGAHLIAEGLNQDKVPVFGSAMFWHRSYILKILDKSPSVIGTYVPHVMEHKDGKKKRVPLDPIQNYFPAVIDNELYQRVRAIRDKTPSPLRGRATVIYNIFAGMVHCGLCGGSMALQNKGERGGIKRLVCTRARYGEGCQYHSVRYPAVEEAFLSKAAQILEYEPGENIDFESLHYGKLQELEPLQKRHDELSEAFAVTKDPGYIEKIAALRTELDTKHQELRDLTQQMEQNSGRLVSKRIYELIQAIKDPALFDRTKINASLRALFSGLSINPLTGIATLGWRHGGASQFVFGFPSE